MEDIRNNNKQLAQIKNVLTQCLKYEKSYIQQYHLYSYLYFYLKRLMMLYDYNSENDQYIAHIIHIILKHKSQNYFLKTNGEKLDKLQKLRDEYIKQIQLLRNKINNQFSGIRKNNQFEPLSIVLFISDKMVVRKAYIDIVVDKKKKLRDIIKTDLKQSDLISKNPVIRLILKDVLIEKEILNLSINDILKLMENHESYIITLSVIVPMVSVDDVSQYIYNNWKHIELNNKSQCVSIVNNYLSQMIPTIKYHENKGISIESIQDSFKKEFKDEKLELSLSLDDTRPILIYNSEYLGKIASLSNNKFTIKTVLEYLHIGEEQAAKQFSPETINERKNIIIMTLGGESWYSDSLSFEMQQIYNQM